LTERDISHLFGECEDVWLWIAWYCIIIVFCLNWHYDDNSGISFH
jgi:hypothetical protein